MAKNELMKLYEEETCNTKCIGVREYYIGYLDWLEPKVRDLYRLMDGNATIKEMANILQHPLAIDSNGTLQMFYHTPCMGVDSDGDGGWYDFKRKPLNLPSWFVSWDGDWENSLTLPDNWDKV